MRNIVQFSVPLLIGNLAQQLYSTVDSIVVGRYVGDTALAAVGASGPVINLLIVLFVGISTGAGIMVSQYFGAKQKEHLSTTVGNCVTLTLISALIIMVLGALITRPLMSLLHTPAEIYDMACDYMTIIFVGILGSAYYNIFSGILRGLGDSVTPLLFLLFSTALNVGLDLLFIVTFHWGVAGAAIATVLAQLLSTIGCYPKLRLHREDWAITRHDIGQHAFQGIPLGLQFSVLAIGIIVVQSVVVKFDILDGQMVSNAAQNGFGAANKFTGSLMTLLNGLGTAMTSFVAQNLGAGNFERIRKGARQALVMFAIATAISAALGFLASIGNFYLHLFLSADKVTADTIRFGNGYMRVDMSLMLFLGGVFLLRNCVQGIGKPQFILGGGVAELVARVLVCLLLPAAVAGGEVSAAAPHAAYLALCLADPMAWFAADLVMVIPFIRNILKMDYRYLYKRRA